MHVTIDYNTPPVQLRLDDLGVLSYHLGATSSLPPTMFREEVFPTHLWHLRIQWKLNFTPRRDVWYPLLRIHASVFTPYETGTISVDPPEPCYAVIFRAQDFDCMVNSLLQLPCFYPRCLWFHNCTACLDVWFNHDWVLRGQARMDHLRVGLHPHPDQVCPRTALFLVHD